MSDKPLIPQVIAEMPFPPDATSNVPSVSQNQPSSIPPKNFPQTVIARHTISDTIDTLAKRIKGIFKLDRNGGIQVGEYQNGVSGEIDITPNGITAINKNNQTTFAIDGDTGDATFMGTLQAGTLIAGDSNVIIGKGSNNGGRIIVSDGVTNRIGIGDV